MTFNEEMPLLTEQELRAADVRIYRPHTTTRKSTFDWDALTPTCKACGQKSGQLNRDSVCPACRAPEPPQQEASTGQPTTRRSAPRANQASSNPRRARGAGASATRKKRPARREKRPTRVGRPLDTDAVVAAYRAGKSAQLLARELRVGRRRIGEILRQAGVQVHRGPHTVLDAESIVEAYTGGQSINDICAALGTTNRNRVRQLIVDAGVEIRVERGGKARNGKAVDEDAIVRAYQDGQTCPQIGEQHGILAKRVRLILDRRGIERRDDRATRSGRTANGASAGKAQLRRLGVDAREVKSWAIQEGLLERISRGMPSQAVIDAYEAAHGGDQ